MATTRENGVLYQNWFHDMDMVYEYFDTQIFYDVKVGCYYVVGCNEKGNIHITQYVSGSKEYAYIENLLYNTMA